MYLIKTFAPNNEYNARISTLVAHINIVFLVLSTVFNALVLLCIRDIDGTLQKILNLKPDKDQKKYIVIK